MKPKLQPEILQGLKFADYRKFFYKELKRMKAGFPQGEQTEYLMLSEFEFADLKGKKIPFIVVGTLGSSWGKFYKTEAKKRPNKDFSKGKVSFGATEGGLQNFHFELNDGKLTAKHIKIAEKALFKKVKLSPKLSENIGAGEAVAVASATAAKMQKAKETLEKQGKTLKESLLQLKEEFLQVKKEVLPKFKVGKAGNKAIKQLKAAQAAFQTFKKDYNGAHKKVQAGFNSAFQQLEGQAKEMAKLALAVKKNKKSLAQELAEAYFMKKEKRTATEKEVAIMQQSLKNAIAYRKLDSQDDRALQLKAIYLTAQHVGPFFTGENTDLVYQKMQA
ncbi:hypothetical protein SapgrDRAFT_2224 [Saprospira grandis DSM 2844]|uniref:Uncharacterized protein n=1 Tax=Saprospira grandis DSM 2844 TaxID=694433 RepID=J1I562_9BACT|nr:hypothetical protein [Saprospira grandis]EJF53900.1 hypothetical protein SapgrDRAFT_2224 [Saprospira grandis DSM 2844]